MALDECIKGYRSQVASNPFNSSLVDIGRALKELGFFVYEKLYVKISNTNVLISTNDVMIFSKI